jgi:hypothetical protein
VAAVHLTRDASRSLAVSDINLSQHFGQRRLNLIDKCTDHLYTGTCRGIKREPSPKLVSPDLKLAFVDDSIVQLVGQTRASAIMQIFVKT